MPRRYTEPEPQRCGACANGGCCGRGDGSGTAGTVALGLSLGVSFLLLVVSGAVFKDFLPCVNVAFVVLLPVAVIISEMFARPKFLERGAREAEQASANFGACFLGVVLVSMVALPLVLLHTRQLTMPGFGLWMASTVISAASAIAVWLMRAAANAAVNTPTGAF